MKKHTRLAFVAGTALGGLITTSVIVLARAASGPISAGPRSVALVTGLAVLLFIDERQVPQSQRQIPSNRLLQGPQGFVSFGLEYGTGLRTYMPSRLPHAVVLVLLLAPSLPMVAVVAAGLGWASARALPAFVRSVAELRPAVRRRLVWLNVALAAAVIAPEAADALGLLLRQVV